MATHKISTLTELLWKSWKPFIVGRMVCHSMHLKFKEDRPFNALAIVNKTLTRLIHLTAFLAVTVKIREVLECSKVWNEKRRRRYALKRTCIEDMQEES